MSIHYGPALNPCLWLIKVQNNLTFGNFRQTVYLDNVIQIPLSGNNKKKMKLVTVTLMTQAFGELLSQKHFALKMHLLGNICKWHKCPIICVLAEIPKAAHNSTCKYLFLLVVHPGSWSSLYSQKMPARPHGGCNWSFWQPQITIIFMNVLSVFHSCILTTHLHESFSDIAFTLGSKYHIYLYPITNFYIA